MDAVHDLGRFQRAARRSWQTTHDATSGGRARLIRWVGPLVALATVIVAANAFRGVDFARVRALVPVSPLFWLVFAVAYFTQPIIEFGIFRWLWRLPAAGFAALVRKYISNEVLIGYSGEIYFYAWARRRAAKHPEDAGVQAESAPFGAIKDVAVLSALTGNVLTLAMFAVARPLLTALDTGGIGRTLFGSIAVLAVSSLALMLFRGRVFSLDRRRLLPVAALQLLRITVTTTLAATMWSLVMPDVGFETWLALATLRLLISRLPLVPNKDVVFAGVAVLIVGTASGIAPLLAMMAGLTIATHLVVGSTLAVADTLDWEGRE